MIFTHMGTTVLIYVLLNKISNCEDFKVLEKALSENSHKKKKIRVL